MRIHGLTMGLIMLTGACGYGTDAPQGAYTKDSASLGPTEQTATVDDSGLRTDADVAISGLYGWIDLMPGVGFAGGPHTRLQVKFKALSHGCTKAEDFSAKLIPVAGKQILTIKRIRADKCADVGRPMDINLNVYGTYVPTAPVVVNGAELPVMERIIY